MTPPITRAIMANRPLYDPDPNTFVASEIVKRIDMRRVRLSDFAVVALQMNIQEGNLKVSDVDLFETVYTRGARPRKTRATEGQPARAPDGTIMKHGDLSYPGDTGETAGPWTTQTVHGCQGYKIWIRRLTQNVNDLTSRGVGSDAINAPLPDPWLLAAANALILQPMKRKRGSSGNISSDDDDDKDTLKQRCGGTLSKEKGKGRAVSEDRDESPFGNPVKCLEANAIKAVESFLVTSRGGEIVESEVKQVEALLSFRRQLHRVTKDAFRWASDRRASKANTSSEDETDNSNDDSSSAQLDGSNNGQNDDNSRSSSVNTIFEIKITIGAKKDAVVKERNILGRR